MRIKPYLPYIGVAVFALAIGTLAGYLNLEQRPPIVQSEPVTTIMLLRPGKSLPAFSLQDANGKPFTRESLTGHWNLLYFGYTQCPDVCPTTLADLAKMTAKLGDLPAAERPRVIFISVDPKRDTLPGLKSYVRNFDADFAAATGSIEQLRILSKALGVGFSYDPPDQSAGYAVGHSAAILVVAPDGKETAIYTPPLIPERMAEDYRFVVKLQGTRS
ncbi:MAG TPA: SCO family protein [Gammaproteobacteria bacterium]|nr:SCO family protein [Gammaproteobacteria bacterium]